MMRFLYELAPPLYLTAIGIAMVGWLWALFVGVEWWGLSVAGGGDAALIRQNECAIQ